ncbi:MAG TPA: hypothetical protein VHM19_00285 [Polyangiales bacterium]|jgi:hypothetical protein|nr:hypothetical protein [Polyangiales bacterium]
MKVAYGLLALLLVSACSFDLMDHPAACKVTNDCKKSGYICYENLCVQGPGGSAGSGAAGKAGSNGGASGSGGTHGAGTSGGASGNGGGAGTTNTEAGTVPSDASLDGGDMSDASLDAALAPGELASCMGWIPSKLPVCPVMTCTGGCSGGWCNIACEGVACVSQTITCPPPFACRISCSDTNSCTGAHFVCSDHPCDVYCTGENACTSASIDCGSDACRATCGTGNIVTFNGGGTSSCNAERVNCFGG